MYWKQIIEIFKVVYVTGFVPYPYLDDPFDDIDNQDKYLLHNSPEIISLINTLNYVSTLYPFYLSSLIRFPFSLSQCNYSISNTGEYGTTLLNQHNIFSNISLTNTINLYRIQKDTYFQSQYISCLSSSINSSISKLLSSYFLIYTSYISSCNIIKSIESTLVYIKYLQSLKPFICDLGSIISIMDSKNLLGFLITNVQMFLSIMGDLSLIDVYLAKLQYAKTYIETLNVYLSMITSGGLIKKIIENYVYIKHNFSEQITFEEDQELNYTVSGSGNVEFISKESKSSSKVEFMSGGRIKIKMPKALFTDIQIFITNIESVIERLERLQEIIKHLDLINQMIMILEYLKYLIINLKILQDHLNRSMSLKLFKNHLDIIKSFLEHLNCIKAGVGILKEFESSLKDVITCVYVLNSMDTLGSIKKYIGNTEEIIKYLKKIQSTFNEVHDLVNLIKGEQSPESFLKILESIKSNVGSLKNTQVLIKNFAELMNGYIDSLKRSTESNKKSIELIRSISSVKESVEKVINYLESVEFIIKNYTVLQHIVMNFVSLISVLGRVKSFLKTTNSLRTIEIVIILLKYYRIIMEELQYAVSMIDTYTIDSIAGGLTYDIELEEYKEDESLKITCFNGNGQTECIEEVQTSITMTTKEKITTIIREMTESFVNLKGVVNILKYISTILPVKGIGSMMDRVQSVQFFIMNMINIISISKDMELIYYNQCVLEHILGYNQISYLITIFTQVLRRFSYLENTLASSGSIMTKIVFITYNEAVLKKILSYISNLRTTINTDVTNLESSVETVLQKFMEKSLESTICNMKETKLGENQDGTTLSIVTPKSNVNQYGNSWEILSHSVVADSKFVITRLYGCKETVDESLTVLNRVEYCKCVSLYKSDQGPPYYKHVLFAFSYEIVHQHLHHGKLPEKEVPEGDNRLCLCLVIKFYLYPTLVKCLCRLIDTDLDILSTLSRKFEKYTKTDTFFIDSSKMFIHIVDVIVKTMYWIRERSRSGICFCRRTQDVYYSYFISTIIYISFLVENIFTSDCKSVELSTRHMTPLLSDLDIIDLNCGKIPSRSPQEGKACHAQNSTCVKLTHRKHRWGSIYYIKVRREKHPTTSMLSFRRLFAPGGRNEYLTVYRLMLSVSCKPFEEDKFGFVAEFPFLDIERTNQQAKLLVGSGCVSSNNVKKSNELEHFKCHKHMIVGICLNMVHKKFDLIKMQISEISILYILLELEYLSNGPNISQIVKRINEEVRTITIKLRKNKMYDSINEISNKGLEGVSNNHYSYNDAYRINTSQAHGLFFQWKADYLS